MSESRKPRRTFSQAFKVESVKLVLEEGQTIISAAKNLGIGVSTLGKWVRAYKREQSFPMDENMPDNYLVTLLKL